MTNDSENKNNSNPNIASDQSHKTENSKTTQAKKAKKSGGIIRWGGIIPLLIISILFYAYFYFFFDSHVRKLIEWGGYQALGSEINVDKFQSSFIKGQFQISRLQMTDSESPDYNSIEISQIRFDLNMDALLRLKFVIEDMGVEGIQFASKRAYRGKVAPPPPVDPNKPSLVSKLSEEALNKTEDKYKNNLLGDIASFMKTGGDGSTQLGAIESTLKSKKLAEDLKSKWDSKKQEWDTKIKELPTESDLKSIKTRFEGIQYKNFKTVQEVDAAVKQFNDLKSDVDTKVKLIDQTKTSLVTDVNAIQTDVKLIDQEIKNDISALKDRLKIPKIDAASIAKSMFMGYLNPYLAKIDRYKNMAQKYLPPRFANMLEKDTREKQKEVIAEEKLIPHPRQKGVTYEFPKTTGYPMFWIKNVSISSKSNAQSDFGDISGEIKDITSNQRQIKKTTKFNIKGDFKSKGLLGIAANGELNNLGAEPVADVAFKYAKYELSGLKLLSSPDGSIEIPKTSTSLAFTGKTVGFKDITVKFNYLFSDVNFQSSAQDQTVATILSETLKQINQFDVNGGIEGALNAPALTLNSSLGTQLETAFQNLLKAKIEEANKKLQAEIDKQIGKIKADIEAVKTNLTAQVNSQIAAAKDQLDSQKKQADTRINEAKKDLENQAKGKLQQDGQKALDDLKKKLGF